MSMVPAQHNGDDRREATALQPMPMAVDTAMAGALMRAEIDTQIATARAYPRSLRQAVDNILSFATLDPGTAEDNVYVTRRGKKEIRGPSIRLAEIIAQCWGNCRVDGRVIAIDRINKVITAEGTFHDLQTNSAVRKTAQRSISTSEGYLYSADMITVTGNAAISIAMRNAILAGVPKAAWKRAFDESEAIMAGEAETLSQRRREAIAAFGGLGVSPQQVLQIMQVRGEEEINLDGMVTLRGLYASIKRGEATVDELLAQSAPERPKATVSRHATLADFAASAAHTNAQPVAARPDGQQAVPEAGAEATGGEPGVSRPAAAPASPTTPTAQEAPPAHTTPAQASAPSATLPPGGGAEAERYHAHYQSGRDARRAGQSRQQAVDAQRYMAHKRAAAQGWDDEDAQIKAMEAAQ